MPTFLYVGGGVSELTFIDSSRTYSAANGNVSVPAAAEVGDVAVLIQESTGSPAAAYPTGFDQIVNILLSGARLNAAWKVLEAGEPGASLTGGMFGGFNAKIVMIFRPDNDIDAVSESSTNSSTSLSAQSVAASGVNAPRLVIGAMTSLFDPAIDADPDFDATISVPGSSLRAGYKIENSAPSDHTVTGAGNTAPIGMISFSLAAS